MINILSVLTVNNKNCQDINQSQFGAKIKVFRVVVNVLSKHLFAKLVMCIELESLCIDFFPFLLH